MPPLTICTALDQKQWIFCRPQALRSRVAFARLTYAGTWDMYYTGLMYVTSASCQLRLVVWTILCQYPESVSLMGPECGSWGLPARSTSMRSYVNIWGALHLAFVKDGNQTISRTPSVH